MLPLIFAYIISLNLKISDNDDRIKNTLKEVSNLICSDERVQNKLRDKDNDYSIQKYSQKFIKMFDDFNINDVIEIQVRDNGHPIFQSIKSEIFREGVSSN